MSQNVMTPDDPDNVPVRFVDGVSAFGWINSTINVTLVTNRVSNDGEKAVNDFIVAARLRFDITLAKFLRDRLNEQIALLETTVERPN